MLEREMEDLIWQHPDKLLGEHLVPVHRQLHSAVGRSDLVFRDQLGRLLLVELKHGKLGRGAIDQILDYFGAVKRTYPSTPVEMLVVANSIPEERRLALQSFNIDHREISEVRFRQVAAATGYVLQSEDSPKSEQSMPRKTRPDTLPRVPVVSANARELPAYRNGSSEEDRRQLTKHANCMAKYNRPFAPGDIANMFEVLLDEKQHLKRELFAASTVTNPENRLYWIRRRGPLTGDWSVYENTDTIRIEVHNPVLKRKSLL